MLRSGVTEKVSTTDFKDISFDDKCTVIGGLRTELETLRVWQLSLTITSAFPHAQSVLVAHNHQ